jgi:hypothetical protein
MIECENLIFQCQEERIEGTVNMDIIPQVISGYYLPCPEIILFNIRTGGDVENRR